MLATWLTVALSENCVLAENPVPVSFTLLVDASAESHITSPMASTQPAITDFVVLTPS